MWKVFQLGVVVAILGLGVMFIARTPSPEGAREERAAEGKGEDAETGLIAKLKDVFGGKPREEAQGGAGDEGSGEQRQWQDTQKEGGERHVDPDPRPELRNDENVKKSPPQPAAEPLSTELPVEPRGRPSGR